MGGSPQGVGWFLVSPAIVFGSHAPGDATGHYRVGGDVVLRDDNGVSAISGADLAVAVVAEVEKPVHHRQRFTVAYCPGPTSARPIVGPPAGERQRTRIRRFPPHEPC